VEVFITLWVIFQYLPKNKAPLFKARLCLMKIKKQTARFFEVLAVLVVHQFM
jgi:hypothetical protein